MSKVSYFFNENAVVVVNHKEVVSKRFLDEEKNPVEWEIRQIKQEESDALKQIYTTQKTKKGQVQEIFDGETFTKALIVSAVVYPDLKNKDLLDNYKVVDPKKLLSKMLSVGEYATLAEMVLKHNDLDDEEIVEAVKNS